MIIFHDVVGNRCCQILEQLVSEYPEECKTISHEGGAGIGILKISSSFNTQNQ